MPKERYISQGKRQKIIDKVRLICRLKNGTSKNNKFGRHPSKFKTKL